MRPGNFWTGLGWAVLTTLVLAMLILWLAVI